MEPATTGNEGGARAIGPMPPHAQIPGFLAERDRLALLQWAVAEQGSFKEAKVFHDAGRKTRVDPNRRIALKRWGLGPFEPLMRERLLDALPAIMAAAGYRGPEPRSIEFELNAYGDGAHFAPHRDIPVGEGRVTTGNQPGEDRLISAVYYFHGEPKRFSGGKLRLYRFGANVSDPAPDDSIGFEPLQNSLLVFPSWAVHGVESVQCPSGRFEDYRFALNCWFCRKTGG